MCMAFAGNNIERIEDMNLLSQYKGLRKETYILCFGRLVTAMGSMIWPMLTMILSRKMGLSPDRIAWITAVMGLLSLPANLIGGKMADRFNKKMNIVYLDMVSVAGYVICALIPLSGVSIVLMFVASTCQNMENPSYNALIADLTTTMDRERAYSLQYLGVNLGFVMAPTIAGFLFRDYLWLAFLISGLSIGCSSVLIYFLVKNIAPEKDTSQKAMYQSERGGESLWAVLREKKIIPMYILAISGYYATYQMYNYLVPLDLTRLHGDSGAVIFGSITSVNCVTVVVFTPLITRMFPRVPEMTKTVLGQTLLLTGFAVFLLSLGRIPFYYGAMLVLTWGEIFTVLAETPYLVNRVPASHRGRVDGLLTVVRTGITSIYQVMIGMIYQVGESSAAWTAVLVFGIVSILFMVLLAVKDRKVFGNLYRIR